MKNTIFIILALILLISAVNSYCEPALLIEPLQIEVIMPEGGLEIREVEVTNSGKAGLRVETDYDTTWLEVSPKRVEISAGQKKKLTVFIIIPEGQKIEHQGFINLKATGKNQTGRVYIRAGFLKPADAKETSSIAAGTFSNITENQAQEQIADNFKLLQDKVVELEEQVTQDNQVITNLRAELKARDIQLVELTQSLQGKEEFDYHTLVVPGTNPPEGHISAALQSLYEELQTALHIDIINGDVLLSWHGNKLCYTLAGKSAFISGSDYLRLRGEEALFRLAQVLKKPKNSDFQLMVVGHTDAVPFSNELEKNKFSNWELSALRSARVVKVLQAVSGYDGRNLLSAGQSCYAPLTENNSAEGRIKNRRVDIFISGPDH
ncbi:MAG TPA: OmpA family protein [bacterium]|nr:OmpA family protein [bacterium]HPN45161.1 OmpA family protein [bacterium]